MDSYKGNGLPVQDQFNNSINHSISAQVARIAMLSAVIGFTLIGPVAKADIPQRTTAEITSQTNDLPLWVLNDTVFCVQEYCYPQYSSKCIFSHVQCSGVWCHTGYSSE